MSEDVIRFVPFNDGREEDCQCARCGGSCEWIDCDRCGGEKYVWCETHPMPGRESIAPHAKVEWFDVSSPSEAPTDP